MRCLRDRFYNLYLIHKYVYNQKYVALDKIEFYMNNKNVGISTYEDDKRRWLWATGRHSRVNNLENLAQAGQGHAPRQRVTWF